MELEKDSKTLLAMVKEIIESRNQASEPGEIPNPDELVAKAIHEVSLSDHNTQRAPNRRHITWDEYFMAVAQLVAKRSKDPATQVGACIVNQQNKIVATGYNGMPNGIRDDLVPWTKEGSFLETKYAYVVHAELNAILNCILTDQSGCRIYVSLFPCNECAKAIIQSGIRLVIYLSDKHKEKDSTNAAKRLFNLAGVRYESYSELCARNTYPENVQS